MLSNSISNINMEFDGMPGLPSSPYAIIGSINTFHLSPFFINAIVFWHPIINFDNSIVKGSPSIEVQNTSPFVNVP